MLPSVEIEPHSLLEGGDGRVSPNHDLPQPLSDEFPPEAIIASNTVDKTNQTLGVWALAALTFFGVSGGPYGAEELVSSGGPLLTILVICIVPWIWCLPTALMTAELATAMPEMGGYIVWVDRAFGPFWAFQNGIWKISCNVIDNVLYPLLFLFYMQDLTGDLDFGTRLLISYALVLVCVILNVLGVDVVSDAAFMLMVLTLLPFLVLVIIGLARGKVNAGDWGKGREHGESPDFGTFLTIALWKTSGYDNVGTCASEVKNPGTSFPKAMSLSVILVTLVYLVPILVGVSYATEYAKWLDGYFAQVGKLVCGEDWLGIWITVTGSITSLAMLNTTICTNSRAIQSMGALGLFPRVFGRINKRFKTPDAAVALNGGLVMLILLLGDSVNFAAVANVSMWFYALTIFILFAAFLRLRMRSPHLPRPYKVPIASNWGLALIVAFPPCLCCALLMASSSLMTWVIGMIWVTITLVLWFPVKWYGGKLPNSTPAVGVELGPTTVVVV
ncbi:hypothetical protein BASA81_005804 [Batrachochytrium salamandrivorans]|nr:hypothetical protein BASA81_005804 [Batrachochytrium salamandrivorans]